MSEQWTFHGLALSARKKWDVEGVLEGIGIPRYRGSDLQVPFQHGRRWIKKRFDRRKVVLSMWIRGKDKPELDSRIDEFLKAIGQPGIHPLVRTLRDGAVRQAQAELCAEIHFIRNSPGYAKFALELELANPFFYGVDMSTAVQTVAANPSIWTHTNQGTAPATKMRITLTGPLSNPILRNQNNGVWIQYLGTIASGEAVLIETGTFRCQKGAENQLSVIKHGGDAYWMILEAGENSLQLETDTTGGTVTIEYLPSYF